MLCVFILRIMELYVFILHTVELCVFILHIMEYFKAKEYAHTLSTILHTLDYVKTKEFAHTFSTILHKNTINAMTMLVVVACTYKITAYFSRWILKVFSAMMDLLLAISALAAACGVGYMYLYKY